MFHVRDGMTIAKDLELQDSGDVVPGCRKAQLEMYHIFSVQKFRFLILPRHMHSLI